MGKRLLAASEPLQDRGALDVLLAETAEAISYTTEAARPTVRGGEAPVRLRFSDLPDCESAAGRLRIEGTVLDGTEIASLAARSGACGSGEEYAFRIRSHLPPPGRAGFRSWRFPSGAA